MSFVEIKGYEGLYSISREGVVKFHNKVKGATGDNFVPEGILRQQKKRGGRLVAKLLKNGKAKYWQVHRLVALHFIPNPENKPQVNHIDGNPSNNHVTNLEWATPSENVNHAFRIGLMKGVKGKDRWQSKPVVMLDLQGNELEKFESISQASKKFGYHKGNIISCCKGRYEQCYGFKWAYT